MTTLGRPNNAPPPRPSDVPDVYAHPDEAHRLFARGVAAARGGHRRMAEGLLTRSVQLNPHNEQAWLWLSGVLDDPHQIAFCLNTVLQLNPDNARAQKGLRWLADQNKLNGTPKPSPLTEISLTAPRAAAPARNRPPDAWWVRWRQWQHDVSYLRIILLSLPLGLVLVALVLHQSFAQAVAQSQEPPLLLTPTPALVVNAPMLVLAPLLAPTPTPIPLTEAELAPVSASRTVLYLEQIAPIRRDLQLAVDTFRTSIGKPGGSVEHTAATQDFAALVTQAQERFAAITPPPELAQAHQLYLQGLEVELSAISAMQEFYESYRVEYANRAANRFQEANALFATARIQFDTRLAQLRSDSSVSVHTLR